MEIEAKYRAESPAVLEELQLAETLGDYSIHPIEKTRVVDRFVDTPDRDLLRRGYVCRIRQKGNKTILTLKHGGSIEGAVHHREEHESVIPPNTGPEAWPESQARDIVREVAGSSPLVELFVNHQERDIRSVQLQDRTVAELSLDRVEIGLDESMEISYEVEIEIKDSGTEEDLAALQKALSAYSLQPETRTKFERGLAWWESRHSHRLILQAGERNTLEELARSKDALLSRRAQLLLRASEGATPSEIAQDIDFSESTVRRWLRNFQKERMAIFPSQAAPADSPAPSLPADFPAPLSMESAVPPEPDAVEPVSVEPETVEPDAVEPDAVPTLTVEQLCDRCGVDGDHARHVAEKTLELFDRLPELHHLPNGRRSLLKDAALLHNVGLNSDPIHHHTVGRDLIRAVNLAGWSREERDMLACITRFHRKKVKPEEEPVFLALPPNLQQETLQMAALLRVGDALDYSGSQTSRIASLKNNEDRIEMTLEGPHAVEEAERANKKSDLWRSLFTSPFQVRAEAVSGGDPVPGLEPEPSESMTNKKRSADMSESQTEPSLALPFTAPSEESREAEERTEEPRIPADEEASDLTSSEAEDSPASKSVGFVSVALESDSFRPAALTPSGTGSGSLEPSASALSDPNPQEGKPGSKKSSKKGPGVLAEDRIDLAGKKVLKFHFQALLDHEEGTLLGDDPEELHDMRVASRRLRAAMRLFGPFLPQKRVIRLEKGLRATGRALGPVRDLDVLIEKARAYGNHLPEEERPTFQPLLDAWDRELDRRRTKMTEYLHCKEFERFKTDFEAFVKSPGDTKPSRPTDHGDDPVPEEVRHLVPGLIWEHYGQVRAYEMVLEGAPVTTYHALRIHCKRLRYTLEFYREALGKTAGDMIDEVTEIQDHLGELQDASVAMEILDGFLNGYKKKHPKRNLSSELRGVVDYRRYQEEIQNDRVSHFGPLWDRLTGQPFRLALGELTAAL